jgi:glycosyltransferase involved in cell wall biosynthesis
MISAIILARNEEKNIGNCIKSVEWCDEIVVIDDYSTDKTVEIAKKYKTKIYRNSLNGNFSKQRNFALSKAMSDWVLFVDSDEVVSDALAFEISNAITLRDQNMNGFNGFYLRRVDCMWGRKLEHGEGSINLIRLAKKKSGAWKGAIHETWEIKPSVGKLNNPLFHYPHKTVAKFLNEINFYTDLRATELKNKNANPFVCNIFIYPAAKFIVNYILRLGFLDGIQGYIIAIIMSFHSFLVRSKLWLLYQNSKYEKKYW